MRIGINLLPYYPGGQGGAEVYIRNLIYALARRKDNHDYVLFMNPRGAREYEFNSRCRLVVVPVPKGRTIERSVIEQFVLPFYERQLKLDVLFSNYVIPFTPGGCARIVNIHDMLYRQYPHFIEGLKRCWWRLAIPLSVKRSDKILTVSNASKNDIASSFPYAKSKILVQSEGVDTELQGQRPTIESIRRTLKRLNLKQPFLLSAATFGPQKNILRLLKAFQIVRKQFPQHSLALTGQAGRFAESVNSQLLENVILTGYVTVGELADIYSSAEIHILPSVFEGFGLSILESQYFGCPVATSNMGAMAEVGGQGVAFFDPFDIHSISNAITSVLKNPQYRARLIEMGHENLRRYSWNLAGDQFLEACQYAVCRHSHY